MTIDQINAASERDLDELIAVELFGWKQFSYSLFGRGSLSLYPPDGRDHISDVRPVPAYSTSGWAGIGLVVDAMTERGWYCEIGAWEKGRVETVFWRESREHNGSCQSDNIGTACCRAALLALNAEGRT